MPVAAPFLLAIAGASCSGKTLLAQRLAAVRGVERAAVLPTDAYYRELSHLPLHEREKVNFDAPSALESRLLIRHVRMLARGGSVEVPCYRYDLHTRVSGATPIPSGLNLVVVEGIFALCWKPLRDLCGLKVFVDIPDAVCLERRVARDMRERGRTADFAENQTRSVTLPMYRRHVVPTRRWADLTLDGVAPPEANLSILLRAIEDRTGF